MGARVLLTLRTGADEAAAALRDAGYTVDQAAEDRLESAVAHASPALCVLEVTRPMDAPPRWSQDPGAPAWIAVAQRSEWLAEALACGAQAALQAPFAGVLLAATVARVLAGRGRDLEFERARLARAREDEWILAGSSPAAKRLSESLARVASTPRTTVLVSGPTGSCPAALARLVHARSTRAAGPLIELQAASVSQDRWRQVLGRADAPGSAEGGSLIVHEVASLDEVGQAALAGFFESRADGAGARARDGEPGLRLVATTTRDLSSAVDQGHLREDLFYRLNVLTLVAPSLGERREDLALLAEHCAARAALELGRPFGQLSADLRAALTRRDWPGELHELCLHMQSLALAEAQGLHSYGSPAGALPTTRDPAAALGVPDSVIVGDRRLKSVEEALIRRVLEDTRGNKLRAAEILGIHRTTLYHKLATYGLGR